MSDDAIFRPDYEAPPPPISTRPRVTRTGPPRHEPLEVPPPPQTIGHRLVIALGVAALLTAGAVAVGGVSLLAGLGVSAVLGLWVLPGGSRRYMARRVLRVVATMFLAMALVWLMLHNFPDASRQDATGPFPAMERYADWLGGLVVGDLGDAQDTRTVWQGISRTLPISMQLLAYSQIVALLIAVPGALWGAQHRGRGVDLAFRAVGLLGLSLPVFVLAPILIYLFGVGDFDVFGVSIGWELFPPLFYVPIADGVVDHIRSVVMPSVALGASTAATYLVLLRSEMLQQLTTDHAALARSKGLPAGMLIRRHAFRPGSPTLVAAIAAQSSLVIGNLVITDLIFTMSAFGDYTLVAIGRRDVNAVAGSVFVASSIVAVISLVADALLLVIDPRLDD